jgi:uncharacterized protein YhfF
MSRKERDTGVRFEREVAKLLNTRRRLRADWSESAPDLETDRLVVECKYRARIAALRWLEQAESYPHVGKVPVVFARERGDAQPVVILRAVDFLELLAGAE